MKAAVRDRYGSADAVAVEEIDRPDPPADGVLVRVRASSVNRGDWYVLAGRPVFARPMMGGILKPKSRRLGTDFAGTVEAVGEDVTDFNPGDEVFGGGVGAFAEYTVARAGVALKPANISFEEAAAVPVAGLTALQAVRDHGDVQPGQKVLINGASGGVGTFAVQVAKTFGAEVTAVCRTPHVELVRSLGADRVIDYTREDFTRSRERYDVMLDVAGSKSWSACKRVLAPRARVVMIGAPATTPVLGPLGHIAATRIASVRSSRTVVFFVAKFNKDDMNVLRDLLGTGKLKPVVERTYELAEIADALRQMGEGHAQGKIVITM
jgi:NADPH:quinone reductase-like Zn-dependent oxidoreductase